MFDFIKVRLRKSVGTLSTNLARLVSQRPAQAASAAAPVAPSQLGELKPTAAKVDDGRLRLPLRLVMQQLPPELQSRVCAPGSAEEIPIVRQTVLPQLARGVVKVRFGELRLAAPHLFVPQADRDEVTVILPLGEILARVEPALIKCQRARKRIEVPADMPPPFDAGGKPPALTPPDAVGCPAADVTLPNPNDEEPEATQPKGAEPANINAPPEAMADGPQVSAQLPGPRISSPRLSGPARASLGSNLQGLTVVGRAGKRAADVPARAISPLEPRPTVVAKKMGPPVVRSADGSSLEVSLSTVWQNWPAAVRDEVVQMGLQEATLALPMDTVRQGLKRGLLSYSWKTLRGWVIPAVPTAVSANDPMHLTLPLVLIAPAFLSLQGDTVQRRKLTLDATIPDLFQIGSQPKPAAPAPAPAAATEVSAPPTRPAAEPAPVLKLAREPNPVVPAAPAPESAVAPTPVAEPGAGGITPLFRKETPAQPIPFTPEEIVYRATALKGIAGAVVTLADGLPVANRLPAGASAEALAALVPQLYNRVGASLKEFQMGELTRLRFCAEEVPWEIFRIGKVYVAAYGRVGESFPEEDLKTLVSGMENVG